MGELMRQKIAPRDMLQISEQLQQHAHGSVDIGYVRTILFPELYNADIPQPMSTQSYCRFTDKKEITYSSQGQGMLLFYPKTNIGPQLWMKFGAGITQKSAFDNSNWLASGFQDYSQYFTQTSLVSAAISLQYIGQLQNEQGYMVVSQLYGINPNDVTIQDIENGQFRAMSKPGDGIRGVYLPKDIADFTYYNCGFIANSGIVRVKNGGKNPENDYIDFTLSGTDASKWVGGIPPAVSSQNSPYLNGANLCKFRLQSDADCLAIYWQGMKSDAVNDLRIDVVRKFNGFPKSEQRDVLDLVKPKKLFDPKKTIDVISELQMSVPQLAGHSLKQMDRVSDQIQEYIPNLGFLYNEGMLKEGSSLEGFGQQLQMLSGNEGNVSAPGRIYE